MFCIHPNGCLHAKRERNRRKKIINMIGDIVCDKKKDIEIYKRY